jgi:hypothetical protein
VANLVPHSFAADWAKGFPSARGIYFRFVEARFGLSSLDSNGVMIVNASGRIPASSRAAHVEEVRDLANKQGKRLEPDGLREGRSTIAATEEGIYRALGLPFIEPELREGRGEIERALKGKLPKLVTDDDLRGSLHCHTDASDGTETLETMAKATRQRDFEYFGVADHSRSAHYAGGLSLEQIEQQHREAERLNRSFGKEFRILKGIESDILADGSLDYPEEVLDRFDFVVASIHGRFKLDRNAQIDRLLKAVSNPHTTILGHMTWRQLQRRQGTTSTSRRCCAPAPGKMSRWRSMPALASRSRLALPPGRSGFRLHHEHQSGRALDP